MGDDGFGQGGPHAGQAAELGGRGGVDVDPLPRGQRRELFPFRPFGGFALFALLVAFSAVFGGFSGGAVVGFGRGEGRFGGGGGGRIGVRGKLLPGDRAFRRGEDGPGDPSEEEQQELRDTYEKCGYEVLFISVHEGNGIDALCEKLRGKTSVVAGPSGVGKSSLLNMLLVLHGIYLLHQSILQTLI